MPLVRVLRSRGARTVIVATGENLFAPGGPLPSWNRQFSNTVQRFTQKAAPSQRDTRDRWSHQGTTLKKSFRSSTQVDVAGMKTHFAVGSTKGYAFYVDQGTKSFQAKILPPWRRGQPSLYESTWRPGPGQPPVGEITVRGQVAQNFFASGLRNGFLAMRIPSVEVPGELPQLRGFPGRLADFTLDVDQALFRFNLEQWREWRDAAFQSGSDLGDGSKPRPARKSRAKPTRPKKPRVRKSGKRTLTEKERQRVDLFQQSKRDKNRQRREAEADRQARQLIRIRNAKRDAQMFFNLKKTRSQKGTRVSLSNISENGQVVAYVVTVVTKSGRKTRREFS